MVGRWGWSPLPLPPPWSTLHPSHALVGCTCDKERGRGSEEEEGISSPLGVGVIAGFAAAGTSTSIATLISSIYVNKYKIYVLVKILVSGKIT